MNRLCDLCGDTSDNKQAVVVEFDQTPREFSACHECRLDLISDATQGTYRDDAGGRR